MTKTKRAERSRVMATTEITDRFFEVFNRMVDVYEQGIKDGADQQVLFEKTRDMLIKHWDMEPKRAANFVRCIIAMVGARHGEEVYSEDELAEVLGYATGLRT